MKISLREISLEDVKVVNRLSLQLGYTLSQDQTEKNIRAVLDSENCTAFAAVQGTKVIGWIGINYSTQIESPPHCVINGLVVDENCRNSGVGKMLIEKAKEWSRERGCNKLRLRCNVKRIDTHMFYQHMGFEEIKEQKVFEINV